MARDWLIEGKYIEYCSCELGCPCETMSEPSQGYCTGMVAFHIDKGHCDAVRLDGLSVIATFYFPRAIHHGQGVMHPIVDDRASDAQKDAIFYILSGTDQPEGTMFQIFSKIVETIREPLFAPILFDWDLDRRRARIEVANTVQARSEPIRNPVTDQDVQILTVLPKGWVFHEAENVAGFAKSMGAIKFDLSRRHSSMANVAWGPKGLVHSYDEYKQKFGRP